MPFKNYYELADVQLVLPIGEKTYTVPPITIDGGVKLAAAVEMPNEEFFLITLGSALAEMRADKLSDTVIARAALTALVNHNDGRAIAELVWETNAVPEALAALLAAQTNAQDSTPSPSTESATPTPSPASTSSTTSRKATPRKAAPRKAVRSRGRTSSSSGS